MQQKLDLYTKFARWLKADLTRYDVFAEETIDQIGRDNAKPRHWHIVDAIRKRGKYIGNDYLAILARLFMARNLQYAGCFKIKPMSKITPEQVQQLVVLLDDLINQRSRGMYA